MRANPDVFKLKSVYNIIISLMVRLFTIYLSKESNPEVLAKKSFTTSHHINNLVVRFSQTVVRQ